MLSNVDQLAFPQPWTSAFIQQLNYEYLTEYLRYSLISFAVTFTIHLQMLDAAQ